MRFLMLATVILLTASLGRLSLSQHLEVDPLPPAGGGVVVEKVGPGSSLERAGIQPGDRLLSWRRLPNPPANPEDARGEIESLFDWKWLLVEQAPRGAVEVVGEREGGRKIFTVLMGSWESDVRPWLPEGLLAAYLEGRELIEAREFDEAGEVWLGLRESLETLEQNVDRRLRCGLLLRMGEVWAEAREWERAKSEYDSALEVAGDGRSRAEIWSYIAANFGSQQLYKEAAAASHKALSPQEKETPGSLRLARDLSSLGLWNWVQGDLETAVEYFHRALTIQERLAPYSLEVTGSLTGLGWVARARSQFEVATEYHQRALAIQERLAPGSNHVAGSLECLGLVELSRGDFDSATKYHHQALAIQEQLAPHSLDAARRLARLGSVALARDDFDSATSYYQQALVIKEKLVPDSLEHASSLDSFGIVARSRGDFDAAAKYHHQALTIREKLAPESLAVAGSLGSLGAVARSRGDFDSATEYYQQALAIKEKLVPDSLGLASSLGSLGTVARLRGDFDAATKYHRQALAIREELAPESLAVAGSLGNLGWVTLARGDFDAATEYYQQALAIREKLAPESLDLATSLGSLGLLAHSRGDFDSATEYYRQALVIEERLAPNSLDVARSLEGLGLLAHFLGDFDAATLYYQQALAIVEQAASKTPFIARLLLALGKVAEQADERENAREYFERASTALNQQNLSGRWEYLQTSLALEKLEFLSGNLAAATKYRHRTLALQEQVAPNSFAASTILSGLGTQEFRQGRLASAVEFYNRALTVQERLRPGSLSAAVTQMKLGEVAVQSGDLEEAVVRFLAALAIQEQLAPGSPKEAHTLKHLGSALHQAGRLEESLGYYLRSIEILESQIKRLGSTERVRANFRARKGERFRGALEVLLELNRPQEALDILERSRARSFLTLLAERDLRFGADVPAELDEARSRLAVLHDRTLRQLEDLSREQDPDQHLTLTKKLRTLRREYEENAEDIKRSSPRLAALQYPEPLHLEEIQETLDPGTLMLSYSVGEAQIDVFAVSQAGGLQVKTIPFGETELRKKVDSFLKLVGESKRLGTERGAAQLAALQRMGEYLYGKLILPVEDLVGESERLLILPDGPLHRLPFGALVRPTDNRDTGTGRDWQYLVEWKPLHQALSATVFAELKKRRPSVAGQEEEASIQISAFGDPAYSDSSERLSEEPSEALEGVGNLEAARARSAFRGCGFKHNPLPHTRREVEEIAALYPGTRSYLGAEATEEAAKALGPDTNILHFAAHGCVDDNLPLNSAVVLTMPKGFPEDRDNGLLQVWEIFERVRLKADLVVLSACQSGLGQELRGEGLIGLTRAFQYAGARTVAATLWRVDDQVTTELMVRFYQHLKSGKAKDEALRAAQMELIQAPISIGSPDGQTVERDVSSPYYWAAFQLYGDWF